MLKYTKSQFANVGALPLRSGAGGAAQQQPAPHEPVPHLPWLTVAVDLLTPPKTVQGNECLLAAIDFFSFDFASLFPYLSK